MYEGIVTRNVLLIAVLALIFVAVNVAAAQAPRLAYVDSEKIINDLPEAQAAQKELEAVFKGWQDELQKMGDELQKGLEEYQKKQALLQPAAKEAEEKRLTDLQQRAREFQAQKFGQGGEAQQLRDKKLAPIRERILKNIEQVAKEESFNFVFDKANDILLLYADAKFDLTYKVLDRLKRGSAKSSK